MALFGKTVKEILDAREQEEMASTGKLIKKAVNIEEK